MISAAVTSTAVVGGTATHRAVVKAFSSAKTMTVVIRDNGFGGGNKRLDQPP